MCIYVFMYSWVYACNIVDQTEVLENIVFLFTQEKNIFFRTTFDFWGFLLKVWYPFEALHSGHRYQ